MNAVDHSQQFGRVEIQWWLTIYQFVYVLVFRVHIEWQSACKAPRRVRGKASRVDTRHVTQPKVGNVRPSTCYLKLDLLLDFLQINI